MTPRAMFYNKSLGQVKTFECHQKKDMADVVHFDHPVCDIDIRKQIYSERLFCILVQIVQQGVQVHILEFVLLVSLVFHQAQIIGRNTPNNIKSREKI